MTEINNFNNFRVNEIKPKTVKTDDVPEVQITDVEENTYVQDTGVLGRSQVNYKGGNPADSAKRGIEIAELFKKYPEYAIAAELFEAKALELLKGSGKSDAEAEEIAAIMTTKFVEENILV